MSQRRPPTEIAAGPQAPTKGQPWRSPRMRPHSLRTTWASLSGRLETSGPSLRSNVLSANLSCSYVPGSQERLKTPTHETAPSFLALTV